MYYYLYYKYLCHFSLWIIFLVLLSGCSSNPDNDFARVYHASLHLDSSDRLPFTLLYEKGKENRSFYIKNGRELIRIDSFQHTDKKIIFYLPVFDSKLVLNEKEGDHWKGYWHNMAKGDDYKIPLSLSPNIEQRFPRKQPEGAENFAGKWECYFGEERTPAIGLFDQMQNALRGTFRTETGDYRYLAGLVTGDSMYLSCFDGAHAFLFKAQLKNDSLFGVFRSGNHYQTRWTGVRNTGFELQSPEDLSYLKEGYKTVDFEFPSLDSSLITRKQLQGNKGLIIQIMGSWCPNCMDETAFLTNWYKSERPDDVDLVAVAFERNQGFSRAVDNLNRLKSHFDIRYPILIGGLSTQKKETSKAFPMLNHIMSYPTTLFLRPDGTVYKIHTGFNGPATGEKYSEFKSDFNEWVEAIRPGPL